MDDHSAGRYRSLQDAVRAAFGPETRVLGRRSVAGGDINRAYQLSLSGGRTAFLKTNTMGNAPFFTAEEHGLRALRSVGAIGVPSSLGAGVDTAGGYSFLLLEYLESAPRTANYWETFGRRLARLHRASCAQLLLGADGRAAYGFPEDNFIGASRQKNTWHTSWVEFYRDCRLLPQVERAADALGPALRQALTRLLDHLDEELREPPFPSLLHGDLWSGNVLCGPDGEAWILDPAVYLGDFETDLAMTELFGRFPAAFYGAYREVNPIEEGYTHRRPLYQLYHLLNHLNLFGAGYLAGVAEIARRYA